MRLPILSLLALTAAFAMISPDDVVPESHPGLVNAGFAPKVSLLATSAKSPEEFIQEVINEGGNEETCAEVANDLVTDTKKLVKDLEKELASNDGSKCSQLDASAVESAKKEHASAIKELTNAKDAHKKIEEKKVVSIADIDKCDGTKNFKECLLKHVEKYKKENKEYKDSLTTVEKKSGGLETAKKTVKNAEANQAKALKKCQCDAVTAYDKAMGKVKDTNAKSKKDWAMAHGILYALKKGQNAGTAPAVKPPGMAKGVKEGCGEDNSDETKKDETKKDTTKANIAYLMSYAPKVTAP